MFSKILIANRGEIAVRIARTVREMGIGTVAVYSEADKESLHVLTADEAVFLGDSDPSASYLNIPKIINAAKKAGAEAIHPGYGFLAENSEFADAVKNAGLTFIGPPADVMEKLGDKTSARRVMTEGAVPVIPGMAESEADPNRLLDAARNIGYPVLVKAAAGGGGKGMRVVEKPEDLTEAADLAKSEALSSFGDGSVYLEKYLDRPKHVEVQVLSDNYGNVIHVFERECSIQRRHQKIIEETPSPAVDDDLRDRIGMAAVAAAKASGYVNAGTVEFLLDQSGNFYFLEVNTRLQVEHPITEMITGTDLVRHQIDIAGGKELSLTQDSLKRKGHSIECRIYAEDPENDFLPSPGKVLYFNAAEGPGVRFDHGIYTGFHVPIHYDPILGKLVVWAEDRPAAINRMIRALQETAILGVKTQIELLSDILSSDEFRSGNTHTHFIDDHFPDWKPAKEGDETAMLGFLAHELEGIRPSSHYTQPGGISDTASPWHTLGNWAIGR